jgi:adenylate cyclase
MKNIFNQKYNIYHYFTFAVLLLALLLSLLSIFQNLQLKIVDTLFYLRGAKAQADTSIVIIAIDDMAMKSLPQHYPFPRRYYAKMIQNLKQAGARLVVFDIEFTEPNIENPQEDQHLARVVENAGNVILAGKIVKETGSYGIQNIYILEPIEPLARACNGWGLVNVYEDLDGFIRRYMLDYKVGEKHHYSLSIEAIRSLENVDSGNNKNNLLVLGRYAIPKATANSMYINYRGPAKTFRTYSLASVLDDSTFNLLGDEDTDIFELHKEWNTFSDKIVMVGATAEEIQDTKLTPFFRYKNRAQKMPGVEVHANALSTILQREFIKDIPTWLKGLFYLCVAYLTTILTLAFRPLKSFLFNILLWAGVALLSLFLFSQLRMIVPLIPPFLMILLTFVSGNTYKIVIEQREKLRIRQTFQHYVAPSIVDKMLSQKRLPIFGGERLELTILFADIKNFTRFSESNEPEYVVNRLSEYFSRMVDIIFKHNGTIDKFVGDQIMAIFGAPYSIPNHAEKACQAAKEMVANQSMYQRDQPFEIRIGINTGKVIVGNLGSSQLFDYTVIGDEVNIASRLEGANKLYDTTIIISENTKRAIPEQWGLRELDYVRVKGKSKAITIYELLAADEQSMADQGELIEHFSRGLKAYRQRQWADALIHFRRILRQKPDDGPARLYSQRCLDYIANPPHPNWDGAYRFESK